MSETTAPAVIAKTAKVVEKAAEKIATDNLVPAVVETAEVALQVPTKFVVSGKLLLVAVASTAVGAAGFYGVQKFREVRAAKKIEKALQVPDTIDADV
jgi:hypothetical protein